MAQADDPYFLLSVRITCDCRISSAKSDLVSQIPLKLRLVWKQSQHTNIGNRETTCQHVRTNKWRHGLIANDDTERTVLSLLRITKLFAGLALALASGLPDWVTVVLSCARCFACGWYFGVGASTTFAFRRLLPRVLLQFTGISG